MGQPISIQRGWRAGDVPAREERVSSETRKACLSPLTSCDRSSVPGHRVSSASPWGGTARWAIWHGRAKRGARAAGRLAQHGPGAKIISHGTEYPRAKISGAAGNAFLMEMSEVTAQWLVPVCSVVPCLSRKTEPKDFLWRLQSALKIHYELVPKM